jgi:hypothetical protein
MQADCIQDGRLNISTALKIEVLMYSAANCLTVRQLYRQSMRGLFTFVCACNDGVLPVNAQLNLHAAKQASIPRPAALYLSLCLSCYIVFPFNEPGLELAAT